MKKIITTLIVVLATMTACTQNPVVFQLYPTQNMWTFIQLNTRNGQMLQIQFDVQGDNRGGVLLNSTPLVSRTDEVNGRFTLKSTQNMWTFILLDQTSGRTWQVQWSLDDEDKRGIIPILH